MSLSVGSCHEHDCKVRRRLAPWIYPNFPNTRRLHRPQVRKSSLPVLTIKSNSARSARFTSRGWVFQYEKDF
eukprot:2582529-Amphidinium_carterae.1